MSLGSATRSLEMADAYLVAVQARLKEGVLTPNRTIDTLDKVITEVRSAMISVVEHNCDGGVLPEPKPKPSLIPKKKK